MQHSLLTRQLHFQHYTYEHVNIKACVRRSLLFLLLSLIRTMFPFYTLLKHLKTSGLEVMLPVHKTFWGNRTTNTTCVFHVETTWKRPLPCRFNVEYTWCVCRVSWYITFFSKLPCKELPNTYFPIHLFHIFS